MRIPPQAKSVFKGEIFEIFQWEQELFDGTTATFERAKRANTAFAIPILDGKIIIADEEQPGGRQFITLPGGRLEKNESAEIGMQRELLEETGLQSNDLELLTVYEPAGKIDWQISIFIARNCIKVTEPHLDPGEKISIKKVNFEEFCEQVFSNEFRIKDFAHLLLRWKFLEPEKFEEFKQKLGLI